MNINDFMLILALQLFEHKIYNKIKDNPDLFLVSTENQKDDVKEDNKNKIQEIIGLHSKLSEDEMLIEVEKEREARAATVYKLYLKYLASLEDKTYAMRFTEFAQRRYGFEPSDIPVEYDEMESQRKL